jgi:hypothetical protein
MKIHTCSHASVLAKKQYIGQHFLNFLPSKGGMAHLGLHLAPPLLASSYNLQAGLTKWEKKRSGKPAKLRGTPRGSIW